MLPETVGQLFVGGMEQPFSCMKVVYVSFFPVLVLSVLALIVILWPYQSEIQQDARIMFLSN